MVARFGIFTGYSREQARIAAIPQTIEDQGYGVFSDEIRSRDGAYRVIGTDVPFTGIGQEFDKDGQIREETNLVDGQQHGLRRTWDSNGQLDYEGNWVKGKKHGFEIYWDKIGEEYYFSRRCYRNGVIVWDWREAEGEGVCP